MPTKFAVSLRFMKINSTLDGFFYEARNLVHTHFEKGMDKNLSIKVMRIFITEYYNVNGKF